MNPEILLINGGARLCAKRQPQWVEFSLAFELAAAAPVDTAALQNKGDHEY